MTKTKWTVTFEMHDTDEPDIEAQKLWIIENFQYFLDKFALTNEEPVVHVAPSSVTDDREQQ